MRKVIIGLIFGSLQYFYFFVLPLLLYELLKLPQNFPSLSYISNVLIFLTIIGLAGGFLSLFILGYRSKTKGFFAGFLISVFAHAPIPLFEISYNSLTIPLFLYNLQIVTPFVLGVLLTLCALPKEDFIPSQKSLLVITMMLLVTYILPGAYFYSQAKDLPAVTTDTLVEPTNSPASIMPRTQTETSCDVDDKEFCDLLDSIKPLVQSENFQTLVTYQNPREVTCDDKTRSAQGLPLGHSENFCKGIPEGGKTKGYLIGYNQSEGSNMNAKEYEDALKTYFTKNKPFKYIGYVVKDDKAYIVYTSYDNTDLFALSAKKYGSDWKLEGITLGVVSMDFTSLDPIILSYIW